ncbi:hypothetical protein F2Z80_23530 [Vibrio fortis]|uniref:Uncharacterized protein n=1 Tax=Vibrio fortis TaxID=212667 RepID=A0A5N3RZQ5_9VIBR|nr:hypothetical protein [Vibrio fortis]KAB0300088.1 hypothetical protein F2Z80_23530 [Vibrio fortis]
MDNLEMQYERLLRHYESVKSTNDKISILDLCHSLRVWVDLFNSNAVDPSFMDSKPFKVAIPGKSILRNNSNLNYIISFMWGGVITMAHENNVFSIDNYSIDDFSMGGEVRYPRTNHSELEVKSFFFYQPNKGSVKNLIAKPIVKRVNLKQWLDGEIVRLNNTEKVIISRKDFINRIANAYGASHSSIDKTNV